MTIFSILQWLVTSLAIEKNCFNLHIARLDCFLSLILGCSSLKVLVLVFFFFCFDNFCYTDNWVNCGRSCVEDNIWMVVWVNEIISVFIGSKFGFCSACFSVALEPIHYSFHCSISFLLSFFCHWFVFNLGPFVLV